VYACAREKEPIEGKGGEKKATEREIRSSYLLLLLASQALACLLCGPFLCLLLVCLYVPSRLLLLRLHTLLALHRQLPLPGCAGVSKSRGKREEEGLRRRRGEGGGGMREEEG